MIPQPSVLIEAVIPHIDVVDHAGDLGLAPSLLDVQRADDVGPTLTAKRCLVARADQVGAADRVTAAPWLSADSVAVKPPPNEAV